MKHNDDFEMFADAVEWSHAERHVRESNEIEGIFRPTKPEEIEEHLRILSLDEITVGDLQQFVSIYAGSQHRLRHKVTDDHYIGRRHLQGGPRVVERLRELLDDCNSGSIDPWTAHVEYELIHPFTDGNGRSGRVLWHWLMKKKYGLEYVQRVSIGFLHRFYYQAMQFRTDTLY